MVRVRECIRGEQRIASKQAHPYSADMSVQQIEAEIAKLAPSELKQLAQWIGELCSAKHDSVRPRLTDATFTPVHCAPDAFAPLTDDELKEFGLA